MQVILGVAWGCISVCEDSGRALRSGGVVVVVVVVGGGGGLCPGPQLFVYASEPSNHHNLHTKQANGLEN